MLKRNVIQVTHVSRLLEILLKTKALDQGILGMKWNKVEWVKNPICPSKSRVIFQCFTSRLADFLKSSNPKLFFPKKR